MTCIYLIGFMGCGKSTIGEQLAHRLDVAQIDTDDYIEEKYRTTINMIFQDDGEITFRNYETEALEEITVNGIISTGGGIVEKQENINIMKTKGIIIYLKTPFTEIVSRLDNDVNRPLWDKSQEEKMKGLFDKRIALYEKHTDYTIDTTNKTIEEIVTEIKPIINEV